MRELIEGPSDVVVEKTMEIRKQYTELAKVTVFFENMNFLITDYQPLSYGVGMILEFQDGRELHLESCKCGYQGAGSRATVAILELFGLQKPQIEEYIYDYDAVCFEVDHDRITPGSLDFSQLFVPSIRYDQTEHINSKILSDNNVSYNFDDQKVTFYNPQRHSFGGLIRLLPYVGDVEFEYYIGENSTLEDYFRTDRSFLSKVDAYGAPHVNLVLHGEKLSVVFLIDRKCEREVINAIHIALCGDAIFQCTETGIFQSFKKLFSKKEDIYGRVFIPKSVVNKQQKGLKP